MQNTNAGPAREASPVLFGGYELIEELGRGGMGVVYRARQIALNRLVALKMLLHGQFADAAFIERFQLEAEAAAHLDHPNIVPIYEVGQHDGQPFYSMKLIAGRSLAGLSAECGVRSAEWLRRSAELVASVARAVHYAHQHGVLHRDIKPHNILVDAEGQPYLADFGLAKLLGEETGLTLGTGLIGSPEFMAPEQAAGKPRQVTTAADVYGLGAVLYVLLTGKAVFHGDTPLETVRRVIEQEPVRPQVLNPAVDRNLETICLKCLQKEPAQRYASAQALAEDLECWLRAEPIQARRANEFERLWLWCRRQPVRAGLTGALLLVFAAGLAGVLWQWRRAKAGELFARQTAYAAAMNLAQRALANNEAAQAIHLLDTYRPTGKSGPDLRHWEWRYLWQLCQGDELATLHRYSSGINSIAVSKDGNLLALGTWGKAVPLWNLATKQPIAELPGTASTLAFSPTDSLLAVATWNEAGQPVVKMWNTDSRKVTATLTNEAAIGHLAFSPDGRLLATSDTKGTIRVTEWKSNRILVQKTVSPFRHPEAGGVAFSPDGRRLAIGGDVGELLLLDWQSGAAVSLETGTANAVTALAVSPAGDLLAAGFGYTDGTIGLWELSTGRHWGKLTNHTAWVEVLAFTPDGQRLVSGGNDGTIRLWSPADRTEVRCFHAYRHGVAALAVLPDGKTLVSGAPDGAVCLWDCSAPVQSRGPARLVISHRMESQVGLAPGSYGPGPLDPKVVRRFGVAFAPDSRSFITSDPEGALAVYDAHSMQIIERLPALGSNNWGVARSSDGRWLAAAKASGKIEIWDWKDRQAVASLALPFQWVGRIRFSRTGQFLLAYSMANDLSTDLRVWETRHWAEVPAGCVRFSSFLVGDLSPDDRLLVLAYADGRVQLSRFPSGHPFASFKKSGGCCDVRFSRDGRLLALGEGDGSVLLWDVASRRESTTLLSGHVRGTWGVVFSSDGRPLLTGGRDPRDAVKLWNLEPRNELVVMPAEGEIFFDVCFSPDGNTLVANSLGGVAHFWRAPSWAEIEAAEQEEKPRGLHGYGPVGANH